jgi:hypothetical protein
MRTFSYESEEPAAAWQCHRHGAWHCHWHQLSRGGPAVTMTMTPVAHTPSQAGRIGPGSDGPAAPSRAGTGLVSS